MGHGIRSDNDRRSVVGMDWRYVSAGCTCLAGLAAAGTLAVVEMTPAQAARPVPPPPVMIASVESAPPLHPVVLAPKVDAAPQTTADPAPAEPLRLAAPPSPMSPPSALLAPKVASLEPQPLEPAPPPLSRPTPPIHIVPPAPKPHPPVVDHRYDGTLTVAEIGRIRASLKLTPEQMPYWTPVANLLRELGRKQMAQVDAGQKPDFDLPGDLGSRFYSAAAPLLQVLRDDQKEAVRNLARKMGYGAYASFI